MKKIISSSDVPAAIGPYSQAVIAGNVVYTSGMIAIVPQTGEIVSGVEGQARQAFTNLKSLLEASGSCLEQVVKTTLFIKDMNDFSVINEIYKTFFQADFPARSCVEVARLPKDVLVEIEAIAVID